MSEHIDVMGEARYAATADVLDQLVRDGATVVEVGASDASFRQRYPKSNWITVDKFGSPDHVVDLNGPECELPFQTGSVDVIICTEVLEHLVVGSPLVREMARVITAEGAVIVSVPNIVSLKSRFKVLLGLLPNMAASGDCGHDLGGFGVKVDGIWVGGHVVDFNETRLSGYLQRGGLRVRKFHKIPITVGLRLPMVVKRRFTIPRWLLPRSFSDFILCEASRKE